MALTWNNISSESDVDQLVDLSHSHPVVIFKHSTRCSISSMIKGRMEREAPDPKEAKDFKAYYLDLIQFRSVSNWIAQKFGVEHESPQVIVLQNSKVVYQASHTSIHWDDILDAIKRD